MKSVPSKPTPPPRKPKIAGAAERSLNTKADAVVARMNKPKPVR